MTYTAIIVDDEPPARARIQRLLREENDIQVVTECQDGAEAIEAIKQHRPDLVFLDVQMPVMNGLEVLRNIPDELIPAIIFTTAFDKYAVEAFEVSAADYLLKPFKPSRFKQALQKARALMQNRTTAETNLRLSARLELNSAPSPCLRRILIKEGERIVLLKVEEIDWIESAGNYLVVHSGKANYVWRETMTRLETQLPPDFFLRVSRSALVNLNRIRELQPLPGGQYGVVLHDGQTIPMTRALREVQERLRFL
jgi:two-component system LytT family response regulator